MPSCDIVSIFVGGGSSVQLDLRVAHFLVFTEHNTLVVDYTPLAVTKRKPCGLRPMSIPEDGGGVLGEIHPSINNK